MRDAVIQVLTESAEYDADIMLLSSDFGAPALDIYRERHPDKFLQVGIAEQNMIDIAAGLALAGKKVFCYAMAPFITSRCYEQIKCSLGAMNLPVTLIGVGVGLGYDNTSMTHICIEDLACMRAINNLEIYTPSDRSSAREIAKLTVRDPKLRYLRLDRHVPAELYSAGRIARNGVENGAIINSLGRNGLIIASGYMVHKAMEVVEKLKSVGFIFGVLDLIRVKPVDSKFLQEVIEQSNFLVTLDEHLISGGIGTIVLESMAEMNALGFFNFCPFLRFGIRDPFVMVNGDRQHLHNHFGLSTESIARAILDFGTD